MNLRLLTVIPSLITCVIVSANNPNSAYPIIRKLFEQCAQKSEMLKCLKIQAIKVADRAVHAKNLNLFEGVSLISEGNRQAKSVNFNESKLQNLSGNEIDSLLSETTARFFQSHKLKVSVPKLVEEGRKKRKGGYGALFWALAIKGSFLAMAYKGIAVMAGTALIVGKMALLLSAILGLKKLVSSGHEKTTFEIIKQPKYSESHTHSTSYEDDGHYHRSSYDDDDLHAQKRIYRAYIPMV